MNHLLQFPYQTSLTIEITLMGFTNRAEYNISFNENNLILTDAKHQSKPSVIEFTSIASISQVGNKISLTLNKPIGPIKKMSLILDDDTTQNYIDYVVSRVEEQNASNPIQTTSKDIQIKQHTNNIENENTSGNIIAKLWNNASALYITSAILLIISLIFIAIINIGYVLVELIGVLFAIIMAIYFNSWKFFSIKDFSKVLFVAVIIGLILMIFTLIIEGPNVNVGWQEEWHKCYKCNGTGKVTNNYGYRVKCPSCNGVGELPY